MKRLANSTAAVTLAGAIALAGAPVATAATPTATTSSQHARADGGGRTDCAPLCDSDNRDDRKQKKIKKFEQKLRKAIEKAIKKARDRHGGDGCAPFC